MEQCIAIDNNTTMIDNSFKYTCSSSGVKAAFFNGLLCTTSLAEMEIGFGTCLGGMKISCSDTASNTNPPPSTGGSGSPSVVQTNGVALPGATSVPGTKSSGLKTQFSLIGVVTLFSLALM